MSLEINVNENPKSPYSTDITQEELKELLDYDPETGIFKWKKFMSSKAPIGGIAGTEYTNGYVLICIRGRRYGAHALAWFYVYGELTLVDHKDNQRYNNALSNLQKVTTSQNNHKKYTYNPLGIKGVRFRSGKYEANIRIEGRITCLGKFNTPEEAGQAYQDAARQYFGELDNA